MNEIGTVLVRVIPAGTGLVAILSTGRVNGLVWRVRVDLAEIQYPHTSIKTVLRYNEYLRRENELVHLVYGPLYRPTGNW